MSRKLAFIGFGGVGQGLAHILKDKKTALKQQYGFDAKVVAVSDMMKGSVYHPDGLDIDDLLQTLNKTGNLENYPSQPGLKTGWDSMKTIRDTNADTIVEVTFTDVKTGQPAIDHCKAAFESGKDVVTTNKGPAALAYQELSELAERNGAKWGIEGTVMSGTPSLRMPLVTLAANNIAEVSGILNGTTNFMLMKMEEGLTYEEALKEAQHLGYAEADPTSDVEGYDARYKVVILANVLWNEPIKVEDVSVTGITSLTAADMKKAKEKGMRWKLLAKLKKDETGITASVAPEMLPLSDPLASVGGATNAITYQCDLAGPITLIGAGAGLKETGFSLLIDLINFDRKARSTMTIP